MLRTINRNLKFITNAYRSSKLKTILVVLLYVLNGCMPALRVVVVGGLINDVLTGNELDLQWLILSVLKVTVMYLLGYIIEAVRDYINYKFSIELGNDAENRFFEKLEHVSFPVLENEDCNDLIYSVKDGIDKRFSTGLSKFLELITFIFNAFSIFSIIISKDILTGIILIIVFFCLYPVYKKIGEDNYEAYVNANKEYRRAKSYRQILSEREYANEREQFKYADFFNAKWKKKYHSAIVLEQRASKRTTKKYLC